MVPSLIGTSNYIPYKAFLGIQYLWRNGGPIESGVYPPEASVADEDKAAYEAAKSLKQSSIPKRGDLSTTLQGFVEPVDQI